MVDASPSIDSVEWELELKFATDTAEAFAKRGIFENGGTVSYVQFTASASNAGTFNSTESFNAHVDNVGRSGGGTGIINGKPPLAQLKVQVNSEDDVGHLCLCHPPQLQNIPCSWRPTGSCYLPRES